MSLVIPLRDVIQVEKVDGTRDKDREGRESTGVASRSVLVSTTSRTSFLFGDIKDRDFFVDKVSELLARTKVFASNTMYVYIYCIYIYIIMLSTFAEP